MDYQTLKYDIDDGLLLLTLNRPDQLNAFTVQMADELVAAYERASLDDAVRVIVVTGAGKAFCAGMMLRPGLGVTVSAAIAVWALRARRARGARGCNTCGPTVRCPGVPRFVSSARSRCLHRASRVDRVVHVVHVVHVASIRNIVG